MNKDLVNSLFSQKISQAKELVQLRRGALESAERSYGQAKKVLNSMKGTLESAESSLRYLESQKKELGKA